MSFSFEIFHTKYILQTSNTMFNTHGVNAPADAQKPRLSFTGVTLVLASKPESSRLMRIQISDTISILMRKPFGGFYTNCRNFRVKIDYSTLTFGRSKFPRGYMVGRYTMHNGVGHGSCWPPCIIRSAENRVPYGTRDECR